MDCLIDHKNDQLMRLHNKCRASVEHYQLINLKDYHFTLKFKVSHNYFFPFSWLRYSHKYNGICILICGLTS